MSTPLFELKRLSFSWQDGSRLLENIDLNISQEERILLRGGNGSGKTTLLRLLTGELTPTSGEVLFDGTPAAGQDPQAWRRIVYLRQSARANLFGLTPRHDLEIWRMAHPQVFAAGRELASSDSLAPRLDQPYATFSNGELRALNLLWLPLLTDLFWLLDEPTAGLDDARKQNFADLCAAKRDTGCGMLVVSHDPALPDTLFDRVWLLTDGGLREQA